MPYSSEYQARILSYHAFSFELFRYPGFFINYQELTGLFSVKSLHRLPTHRDPYRIRPQQGFNKSTSTALEQTAPLGNEGSWISEYR